jgi:hypothetical protein
VTASTVAREEVPDFLSHCQASSTGNPMLEQIKDRGADAVLAIFRLVKNGMVHAIDNQAVLQSAGQSRQILADFASVVGNNLSITFLGDTIFVCGQLLRASRAVYESAIELGEVFARCNVSELTIESEVTVEDMIAMTGLLVQGYRVPERRDEVLTAKIPHVSLKKTEGELTRRNTGSESSLEERILRLYATSLVVLRGFFDSVANGTTVLPYRIKRLSQQLVSLTEKGDVAMLGLTAMGNAHRDDAGRAVLSAILALVIARQVTSERLVLARLTMAALMADSGRVRIMGAEGRDTLIALDEDTDMRVPAATATVCIATGGVNVTNALRTVVTSEATILEREKLLGPLYGRQMTPLVEAQVLRLARALLDHLAPRDAAVSPKSPLDALEAVAATPGVDQLLLRLFVTAVGLVPTGSVVEFETGEWGVVVGPSKTEGAFDRPIVRLVTDRSGRPLNPPREVDLGGAAPGSRVFPRIANVVPPKQARFNVTRVFFG